MIRPFSLNDILLMRRLQHRSASLAIEHGLTHPQDPLWIALSTPWPWAGFGIATYVLSNSGRGLDDAGFVQLVKRSARPEADILYVAPVLPAGGVRDAVAEMIWRRLLEHCILSAAGHSLQRIYASCPDGGPEEACLREAGFSLYAREQVFRLAAAPAPGSQLAGFRLQGPQDSWALQRLYTRNTPRLVQQAEGAVTGDVGSPALSWWEPDRWLGSVWEPAGEVRGAVQVHIGHAGHWLRLWGANALASREVRGLIEQGLRLIALAEPRARQLRFFQPPKDVRLEPIYVTVRDYDAGLSSALTGFGFAPFADRARFVKHTVAPIREQAPVPAAIPALATSQKVAARVVEEG